MVLTEYKNTNNQYNAELCQSFPSIILNINNNFNIRVQMFHYTWTFRRNADQI